MEGSGLALARLRPTLGQTWLIALFGCAYLVSQLTIGVILAPLGRSIVELQCLGFSAEIYRETFARWEAAGLMSAYRAHFVLDGVHWILYSGFATTLLCRLFERCRLPHRLDWLLLLPLISGLCDAYENHLQQIFLAAPDHAAIVDPLPLLSTIASDAKWAIVSVYVVLTLGLIARARTRPPSGAAG